MEENVYESLTAILMQELFENGLFDINELATKYRFNNEMEVALKNIYNEYFGED